MNESRIEQLLRQAPRVRVPAELLDRLRQDIRVRAASSSSSSETVPVWARITRRLPALSFGLFFLSCLAVVAVQGHRLAELRRQLEALRTAPAENQRRIGTGIEADVRALHLDLERLRKDNRELAELRAEARKLQAEAQELEALRAENQRLLMAPSAPVPGADEFFARAETAAKERALSTKCINHLKQIGLAARIWAIDNADILPSNFRSMTNELTNPQLLVCPSDPARRGTTNWTEFGPAHLSYEMISPGVDTTRAQTVYVRCPIHGHVTWTDGSVHSGKPKSDRSEFE